MNWTAVERLFAAVIEVPPEQRRALVDSEPDEAVRREVRKLLARHDALQAGDDSFLSTLDLRDAAKLVETVEPDDPPVIGRYEVVRRLGRGATGIVYLARDPALARPVALKVLASHLSQDDTGVRRFTEEARAASRLDNPHIVEIHEIGRSDNDHLFIAMAYHEGETLRDRIGRGALPVDEAVRIAGDVADGLSAAHANGIVHRDIKPENILLTARGARILDFGIAKVTGEALTLTGATLGTAAYMSPEQTRGTVIDHRSDLWSVGVVLHEMLVGQRPFQAEGSDALVYQIRNDPAPDIAALRPEVPVAVVTVVHRCLEKDPAGRYSSADALLAALRPGSEAPSRRVYRTRRRFPVRAALLVLGAIGAAGIAIAAYRTPADMGRIETNLVAVAPFDVLDPSLELWHEGLMDVLTEDLDGAGPLSTVAQSVVLRRWSGQANRESAASLGERTGAELVVFGQVARRGQDSVSIRASVLDRSTSAREPELLEVTGPENRMGELVDSLGVRILRSLGRYRAIGSQRHISIGSRSLPALKDFLRGEQFYRQGQDDSALARYDRAIANDSTFALALRRMSWLIEGGAPTSNQYGAREDYYRRAAAANHGLSPRDSVLLLTDSLNRSSQLANTPEELIVNTFRAMQNLEDLARRYPEDPSIWYELGEARHHGIPPLGGRAAPALEAFDRAIALDSGFAPAYQHTMLLALQLGKVDLARAYARAYVALNSPDHNAPALPLAATILDSGVHAPSVWQQVQSASVSKLSWLGRDHFRWLVDSGETAIVLLQELATGTHDSRGASPFARDSVRRQETLAAALIFRGHLRAGANAAYLPRLNEGTRSGLTGGIFDRFLDLALLGTLPDSIVQRTFAYGLTREADWGVGSAYLVPTFLRGMPWWFARGDRASLARFSRRAGEIAKTSNSPVAIVRGRYLETAANGYLALLQGDSAAAERIFGAISDSLCLIGTCFMEKLTEARLLVARGKEQRSAAILEEWEQLGGNSAFAVIAALERGKIAERLGDRVLAVDRYQFVVDAWRRADPELQPLVEEARAGLQRHRR